MNRRRRLLAFSLGVTLDPLSPAAVVRKIYRVGMLSLGSAAGGKREVEAIRARLRSLGYVEGRNLVLEVRFAEHEGDRLPVLAAELMRLEVDVIVTITTPAAMAARAMTSTIPIVMAGSASPVELGLVDSLAHPGGNVTGVTNSPGNAFVAKQLQLLKEVAPAISRVALLGTSQPVEGHMLAQIQAEAERLGVTAFAFRVDSPTAIDLDALAKLRVDALYVFPTANNSAHINAILGYAARNRLPAMYGEREQVVAGGLMSYWTDWIELRRHAADFVGKILTGAKPADLPVEQPTIFELVINLKTAKALGLTIPQSVLVRADEVIH